MRTTLLFLIFLIPMLGCNDKASETHTTDNSAILEVQPEAFAEENIAAILSKKVPDGVLTTEYEIALVLPFYYDYLEVDKIDEIREEWLWGGLSDLEGQPIKGFALELKSFLSRQFGVDEKILILDSEIDGLVSTSGLKESSMYEESSVLHEDDNSLVYIYANDHVRAYYFAYDAENKTYLLYQADMDSFSDLSLNERKQMAFELLRNAKNLQNKVLFANDLTANSWEDYARAQPEVITRQTIASFERLKKQVSIFMDPGEEFAVKSGTNNLVKILRPDKDAMESIPNFLFALETGVEDDISKRRNNLSNAERNFLGIPYNKEDISYKIDKRDDTYQITMSYHDYNEKIISDHMVISFLRKNDELFFFRMTSSSKIQMDYHTKLSNYYIRNGTLSYR